MVDEMRQGKRKGNQRRGKRKQGEIKYYMK